VLTADLLDLDRRLDNIFSGWARRWDAVEYRFPAYVEARHLERLDYFQSFPHLATFPVTLSAFLGAYGATREQWPCLDELAP